MRILIIDNYDSFVYNLVQYVGELGASPVIYRNDSISLSKIQSLGVNRIIISPGPGNPERKRDIGICLDVIRELGKKIPLLGVCLGHQAIVYAFGGKIVQAKEIMHGKTCEITHNGKDIFEGIRNPLKVMRYHSLIADSKFLPEELEITAKSKEEIFAVRHREYPIWGVQFHPESIGTQDGKQIVKNFLEVI